MSFRLLSQANALPSCGGQEPSAKVHLSYGRKYECPFGQTKSGAAFHLQTQGRLPAQVRRKTYTSAFAVK